MFGVKRKLAPRYVGPYKNPRKEARSGLQIAIA
jgi:hypothetical protein